MIKSYTTLILDMYGVILNEPKGRLLAYSRDNLSESEYNRVESLIHENRLFDKAGLGEINAREFMQTLGFDDWEYHSKQYIDNYLTLDSGFLDFAERVKDKYELVLLSNDVAEWSEYICKKFGLDKYFSRKIISAEVKIRKPSLEIYDLALEKTGKSPYECIFVDNSAQNLVAAEEVGISPILFNRENENYYGMTVYSFKELYDILG
ncbi:MAG: HAD-IA family hydrolase [Clostridia bacterium]|nr:HAD-IA family hydrolase [Clostridia bacterium]